MDDKDSSYYGLSWFNKIAIKILTRNVPHNFLSFLNIAVNQGNLDETSKEMINGVLKITYLSVRKIMIPSHHNTSRGYL